MESTKVQKQKCKKTLLSRKVDALQKLGQHTIPAIWYIEIVSYVSITQYS